jgi:ribonuclease-3
LASALEALAAAIYLDGGFPAAHAWARELFAPAVKEAALGDIVVDYKTKLQELLQAKLKTGPKYVTVSSSGPDHDKTFVVEISVASKVLAQGKGKSKKEAEQSAAKAVLSQYGVD